MAGQCGPSLLRSDPDQRLQEPPFHPTHREEHVTMTENPYTAAVSPMRSRLPMMLPVPLTRPGTRS